MPTFGQLSPAEQEVQRRKVMREREAKKAEKEKALTPEEKEARTAAAQEKPLMAQVNIMMYDFEHNQLLPFRRAELQKLCEARLIEIAQKQHEDICRAEMTRLRDTLRKLEGK